MKRTAVVLFFFLAIFVLVQPAYAYQCGTCQDSTGKFIGGLCLDGTPVPSCPPLNVPPPSSHTATIENNTSTNTGSSTTVHIDTQSAPTHPPTIVTIVVTATPSPTPA